MAVKALIYIDIMKHIIQSKQTLKEIEQYDDSTTGYGHDIQRHIGRIEGFQKALEIFESHYGGGE
jgi:hypothetical protein